MDSIFSVPVGICRVRSLGEGGGGGGWPIAMNMSHLVRRHAAFRCSLPVSSVVTQAASQVFVVDNADKAREKCTAEIGGKPKVTVRETKRRCTRPEKIENLINAHFLFDDTKNVTHIFCNKRQR